MTDPIEDGAREQDKRHLEAGSASAQESALAVCAVAGEQAMVDFCLGAITGTVKLLRAMGFDGRVDYALHQLLTATHGGKSN